MQDGIRHPPRLLHIGVAQSSKKSEQFSLQKQIACVHGSKSVELPLLKTRSAQLKPARTRWALSLPRASGGYCRKTRRKLSESCHQTLRRLACFWMLVHWVFAR